MDVAFITRRLMGEWCADALIILITFNSNVQLDGQRSQIRVYIYLFLMCKDNWGVIFLHWMSGQLFLHCPSLCLFIQQNNVWGVAWDKWRNRPYLHQLQENLLLINTRLINCSVLSIVWWELNFYASYSVFDMRVWCSGYLCWQWCRFPVKDMNLDHTIS